MLEFKNTKFINFTFIKTRIILNQIWYQSNLYSLKGWRAQLIAKDVFLKNKDANLSAHEHINLTFLPWFDTKLSMDLTLNPTKQYKFGFDAPLWHLKKKSSIINNFNFFFNTKYINYLNLAVVQLNGLGFKTKTSYTQWVQTFLTTKQLRFRPFKPQHDLFIVDPDLHALWFFLEDFVQFDFEANPKPEILENFLVDYNQQVFINFVNFTFELTSVNYDTNLNLYFLQNLIICLIFK